MPAGTRIKLRDTDISPINHENQLIKLTTILLIVLVFTIKSSAQLLPTLGGQRAGISTLQFLKIGVGGRASLSDMPPGHAKRGNVPGMQPAKYTGRGRTGCVCIPARGFLSLQLRQR